LGSFTRGTGQRVLRDLAEATMSARAPSDIPPGATATGDGIPIGAGPVSVDAYIDFLCPFCRDFELSSEAALNAMIADGAITLVYHPMSFLDDASTTRYSSRAAAAAGCASDYGKFPEYVHALFASQPPEGGPGLSDAELVDLGGSAGLAGPEFGACVRSGRYLDWPAYVTDVATGLNVSATPTVLVDGIQVAPDMRSIAAAAGIRDASAGK
jgi:protein-disulfide isomerase